MTRTTKRRRGRLLAAAAAVAAALTLAPAGTASALPDGVYSVPYSSQLYTHHHGTIIPIFLAPVSYDWWRSYEFPTPRPAPTDYVRQSWSPVVYAVTTFDVGHTLRQPLSLAEWQRAGSPNPRLVPYFLGTGYYTIGRGPEIYAALDGYAGVLTLDEWLRAGSPQPQYSTPLAKLSWADGIVDYSPREPALLTLDEWIARGQPRPWTMQMLPGDAVCFVDDGPTISYAGSTYSGTLTFAQWQAAGSPLPAGRC